MTFIRRFFMTIALAAGIGCASIGSIHITNYKTIVLQNNKDNYFDNQKTTTDSVTSYPALNGSAIGLGLISGMSLLALGISYIGKEEK